MARKANELARAITQYLQLKGFMVWRGGTVGAVNGRGQFYRAGTVGSCDLYAIRLEKHTGERSGFIRRVPFVLGVEIKTLHDRIRPEQAKFHEAFTAHGGVIIIARCVQDVERAIQ